MTQRAPEQGKPVLPDYLLEVSQKSGGRGVALKNTQPLGQLGVAISIGQSPGPGTGATVYLATNSDGAYAGALVTFFVQQYGRIVPWQTFTIDPILNNEQPEITYTTSGCAADFWLVSITLTGGTTPAQPLQSSIIAFGVENLSSTGSSGVKPLPPYTASGGPGATGTYEFPLPAGTTTYLVTQIARVSVAGGGAEAVGDSYSQAVIATWNAAIATSRLVPAVLSPPSVSADTSMATTSFGPGTGSGGNASIPWTIPATLDAGTTVLISITLLPLGNV